MLMLFSRVFSAQPNGLGGALVAIETDISKGLHSFSVVGLPGKAVDEAKDRISSAIKNSGFPSPKSENQKIVIALAPAELKKDGAYFDVAMAVGYLISSGKIVADTHGIVFLGELALNGEVQPIKGTLPLVQAAAHHGFHTVIVPQINAQEALLAEKVTVYAVQTLTDVVHHITGTIPLAPALPDEPPRITTETSGFPDFADIRGQEIGKRALEIAAAGGHNIVLYGPPGTGKTTLARACAGILPQLSKDEALEVTGIHSIAGTVSATCLIATPPFRSPHHTASTSALIGGGSTVRPGEVTLAHRGVLFLDEFPEFDRHVIEALRQPIEDKYVTIVRAASRATFPTHFMLIAAMNPPDAGASQYERERYRKKLSGPIMDRIDMWVPVEHITYEKMSESEASETSADIQRRVLAARIRQHERFKNQRMTNSSMNIKQVQSIRLDEATKTILHTSAERMQLSPRAYHRIIKLARTIADLEGSEHIQQDHVLEALQYRQSLPWL